MITRIEIDGFKSFVDFSLDLHPFTAVIGTNASGKSNLVSGLGRPLAVAPFNDLAGIQVCQFETSALRRLSPRALRPDMAPDGDGLPGYLARRLQSRRRPQEPGGAAVPRPRSRRTAPATGGRCRLPYWRDCGSARRCQVPSFAQWRQDMTEALNTMGYK